LHAIFLCRSRGGEKREWIDCSLDYIFLIVELTLTRD
jgi:hypothetical protein